MSGPIVGSSGDFAAGFYGKLPTHGDFVSRRLPRVFIDTWDEWLQQAIARSRDQLREHWLEVYLTSPIWRFVLSAGVCSEAPWAGVLMPSVDRVGRYFPLTIAACLPKGSNVVQVLLKADRWFMEIEQLALSCLDDTFELGVFDDALQALDLFSVLPAEVDLDVAAARDQPDRNAMALHFEPVQPGPVIWPQIAGCVLQALVPDYSLWLTNGSDRIQASLLVCAGLPSVERFSALLDGRWVEWSWQDHQVAAYFNTTEK